MKGRLMLKDKNAASADSFSTATSTKASGKTINNAATADKSTKMAKCTKAFSKTTKK